uniref:RAB22A, member RAS onco family n=1 Tax=Macaca fascicularis TaxID=9541 RepID=A0A2K5VL94_MACFA
MGLEAGRTGVGEPVDRGGAVGFRPRPGPRRPVGPAPSVKVAAEVGGRSGDPAGVPRWRRRRRPEGRGGVQAAKAGPTRLAADRQNLGPEDGRQPPLRGPGLGCLAAAAPGDAPAGPGLSFLNLGRRRARARGSRAMALRELKVCLLGDTGVGKSSIVWRFVEDSFDPNINPTIGASFMTKTVQYQNELHKFLIWDTAGQERFRALAPMYYRGSAAAIIVYDITKEETFSTLKNWVKELRQHGPPNIVVAIAGNKCDLIDVREVMERDAKDYADSIHAIFVETSAKNAININELFIEISRRIPSTDANPPSGSKGFKLRRQPSEPKRSCC